MDHDIESFGFAEFERLSALFRGTLALLDGYLATGEVPAAASELLATEALPHVEDVEAGFRAWLRAGQVGLGELRTLVRQSGVGLPAPRTPAESRAALIEAMQRRASPPDIMASVGPSLAALEHARLVFALLPRTPETEVRFPAGRRSYADIPTPRSPVELAARIEELERELWSVATGRPPEPRSEVSRRTYGFFDTAARLSSFGLQPGN